MNIASPPRFGAGTLVTPAAWLSTGLSPGDTDRAVLEGDGVSDALPAAGVLAGRPLVAGSDPVSLACAVREIFFFDITLFFHTAESLAEIIQAPKPGLSAVSFANIQRARNGTYLDKRLILIVPACRFLGQLECHNISTFNFVVKSS